MVLKTEEGEKRFDTSQLIRQSVGKGNVGEEPYKGVDSGCLFIMPPAM